MGKELSTSSVRSSNVEYQRLKEKIVPNLLFNQTLYEQALRKYVSSETLWLDAGCGHKILPSWRIDSELKLVANARFACGCDVDGNATQRHASLRYRVICDLAALPFKKGSFTLVTCNMVAEHLVNPRAVFAEFARVLQSDKGVVIIHTPYRWSYFAIISRLVPQVIKNYIGRHIDGRPAEDYYPVQYRCNTPRKLRRIFSCVGMQEMKVSMYASDASLQFLAKSRLGRLIVETELYLLRLSLRPRWSFLRLSICGIYKLKGQAMGLHTTSRGLHQC